jgi:hypothetical protein
MSFCSGQSYVRHRVLVFRSARARLHLTPGDVPLWFPGQLIAQSAWTAGGCRSRRAVWIVAVRSNPIAGILWDGASVSPRYGI